MSDENQENELSSRKQFSVIMKGVISSCNNVIGIYYNSFWQERQKSMEENISGQNLQNEELGPSAQKRILVSVNFINADVKVHEKC